MLLQSKEWNKILKDRIFTAVKETHKTNSILLYGFYRGSEQ